MVCGIVMELLRWVTYLEDHPRTCKWLITMVSSKSPKDGVVGPLTNGPFHGL